MRDALVDKMNGYAHAWRALDPERLASFYADDPAFRVYNDGHVLTRAQLTDAIREICASTRSFQVNWEGLEVTPLGDDAALAASHFTRVIVAKNGESTKDWGAVTWVWVRRGDEWKIIHGQGVHYPGERPSS